RKATRGRRLRSRLREKRAHPCASGACEETESAKRSFSSGELAEKSISYSRRERSGRGRRQDPEPSSRVPNGPANATGLSGKRIQPGNERAPKDRPRRPGVLRSRSSRSRFPAGRKKRLAPA